MRRKFFGYHNGTKTEDDQRILKGYGLIRVEDDVPMYSGAVVETILKEMPEYGAPQIAGIACRDSYEADEVFRRHLGDAYQGVLVRGVGESPPATI